MDRITGLSGREGRNQSLTPGLQPWGCTQESLLVLSHKNLLKGKEKKVPIVKSEGGQTPEKEEFV